MQIAFSGNELKASTNVAVAVLSGFTSKKKLAGIEERLNRMANGGAEERQKLVDEENAKAAPGSPVISYNQATDMFIVTFKESEQIEIMKVMSRHAKVISPIIVSVGSMLKTMAAAFTALGDELDGVFKKHHDEAVADAKEAANGKAVTTAVDDVLPR